MSPNKMVNEIVFRCAFSFAPNQPVTFSVNAGEVGNEFFY